MKKKNIFIFLGNSVKGSFSSACADAYESGAKQAGHSVKRMNIGDMKFDPILHQGYREIQPLEPDLLEFQGNINWADHIVILYPNWWSTMPALLKGVFDRAFLPGFAFNFDKKTKTLKKLLAGKSARVIIIAGTDRPWRLYWKYGDFTNEISKGILGFSGFNHVKVSTFGPAEKVDDATRKGWLKKIEGLGKKSG